LYSNGVLAKIVPNAALSDPLVSVQCQSDFNFVKIDFRMIEVTGLWALARPSTSNLPLEIGVVIVAVAALEAKLGGGNSGVVRMLFGDSQEKHRPRDVLQCGLASC
jgi:hypothetical protein